MASYVWEEEEEKRAPEYCTAFQVTILGVSEVTLNARWGTGGRLCPPLNVTAKLQLCSRLRWRLPPESV